MHTAMASKRHTELIPKSRNSEGAGQNKPFKFCGPDFGFVFWAVGPENGTSDQNLGAFQGPRAVSFFWVALCFVAASLGGYKWIRKSVSHTVPTCDSSIRGFPGVLLDGPAVPSLSGVRLHRRIGRGMTLKVARYVSFKVRLPGVKGESVTCPTPGSVTCTSAR